MRSIYFQISAHRGRASSNRHRGIPRHFFEDLGDDMVGGNAFRLGFEVED